MIGIRQRLEARGLLAVCEEAIASFYVDMDSVMGRARTRSIVTARHACWAALRGCGLSYPEIGHLWDVHHTTVLAALKKGAA